MTEPADLQHETGTRAPAVRRRGWLNLRCRAWWIVSGYAAFAALWIYCSDRALASWVTNPDLLMRWSVYKGLVFVIVTSLLLQVMLRQVFGDIETGYAALKAQETKRRQAELAALSEEHFSDTMIESMAAILYFYDSNGRFLRWNKNFEQVSGYTAEEIARMHPLDFFAPADRPLVELRIADVFTKGESWIEAPFQSKDGRATPYFFTAFQPRWRLCEATTDSSCWTANLAKKPNFACICRPIPRRPWPEISRTNPRSFPGATGN